MKRFICLFFVVSFVFTMTAFIHDTSEVYAAEIACHYSHTRPNQKSWHTLDQNRLNGENPATGLDSGTWANVFNALFL